MKFLNWLKRRAPEPEQVRFQDSYRVLDRAIDGACDGTRFKHRRFLQMILGERWRKEWAAR